MSLAELGSTPGKVETMDRLESFTIDPLSAFAHLCAEKPNALLLESAEIDSKDNLQSLLMVDAALRLECNSQQVRVQALTDNGRSVLPLFSKYCPSGIDCEVNESAAVLSCGAPEPSLDEDSRLKAPSVFDALRLIVKQISPIRQDPHAVFMGGVFAYDLLATFESLPEVQQGENDCPDYVFYLAETLLTIDHQAGQTRLIGSVFSGPNVAQNYFAIAQRLEYLQSQLKTITPSQARTATTHQDALDVAVDKDDARFCEDVLALKSHILAGDIFQVVPSRTFSLPCPSPLTAYAQLKQHNPSPYMFYMQDKEFTIFGASPESALKYDAKSNQVEIYPIAGTRPRGKRANGELNPDLDSRIELDLREDTKEKAEHIMLVDLARNDVAKVSQPGTRYVKDLLKVDRYSHVMHLVSRVVGQLHQNLDALHAYQACMNMGTLVGAPKVSAATLIRGVEGKRRGSYGGAVGYINGQGDMDTCIVIRSAFVKNGRAYIQAGAGVVHDSDPQAEAQETRSKAQAVINAVQASQHTGEALS
ncbi:anthranilate synthase component 1 [Alteromonas aestuariivivens]|uniref:Anthranilate synthase component 1 n=1 Tax=Alteromonas aestuariivivens TaxID=1938339 RepID=A0A3D8M404_9ALTE|nr:anthranilate synthase component 1 [Alteromonas aestuariivivens]RDV24285.1 anthranilate synthase component 1 [Alteromonas aestuariivivens]